MQLLPNAPELMRELRHPLAPLVASGIGIALLIWLAVQIAIVGYSSSPPLQPFYLLVGAALTVVGLRWVAAVGPSHPRASL